MCLRGTLTSERWRQCRRHLIYAHFASTQVSFERWRLHGILFRRWSGWHVSVKWIAEVCVRGVEREGGLLGSTLTRFDTRDGRERRRTLRSTIRGSNWWTNTCKHVSIYHLYTLAYTQRSTFGPRHPEHVWCVFLPKGWKEERKKWRHYNGNLLSGLFSFLLPAYMGLFPPSLHILCGCLVSWQCVLVSLNPLFILW